VYGRRERERETEGGREERKHSLLLSPSNHETWSLLFIFAHTKHLEDELISLFHETDLWRKEKRQGNNCSPSRFYQTKSLQNLLLHPNEKQNFTSYNLRLLISSCSLAQLINNFLLTTTF